MTGDRLIRADTAAVVTAAATAVGAGGCCGSPCTLSNVKPPSASSWGPAERREQLTPHRSAGRIESELWDAFLAECKRRGLTNTDGMREMIRSWAGMPEPVPPVGDTGSAAEVLSVS